MALIVVCPGVHDAPLTRSFLHGLSQHCCVDPLVFPADRYPAYSSPDLLRFLGDRLRPQDLDLVFIGFSAGVVGAIATAHLWQQRGGRVTALIALDGWGVPLAGNFAIHRLSHDGFTHWSSALLGRGSDSFYADPPVAHLDLWRSPQRVSGYWTADDRPPTRTIAASFLSVLLHRYAAVQER